MPEPIDLDALWNCSIIGVTEGRMAIIRAAVDEIGALRARVGELEGADVEGHMLRGERDALKVKAECYGRIVHGCSPSLKEAGFPVDASGDDGAVGGIARSVNALKAQRDFFKEGLQRARRALEKGNAVTALEVIEAALSFHPMHAEDWPGWPDDQTVLQPPAEGGGES